MVGLTPMPPRVMAPVVIPQDVPVYRVKNDKGFFGPDDHLYKEGEMIVFLDTPNPEFEPLNDLARQKMKEYLEFLDEKGMEAAAKAGKSYISLADAFENSYELARQDGQRVRSISAAPSVPLMGAKKKVDSIRTVAPEGEAPIMGNGALSVSKNAAPAPKVAKAPKNEQVSKDSKSAAAQAMAEGKDAVNRAFEQGKQQSGDELI